MFQNWFFLTLFSGLSAIVFNFTNRHVLKSDNDSTSYAWWFEFFRFVIFLPFFVLSLTFPLNLYTIELFLLIGLSEFLSVYYYMKMHSTSELSVSTTVTQLRLVWVPLLALIFLNERLLPAEYVGILLIFLGQIVTTVKKNAVFDKGIKFAIIASVFASTNSILFKNAIGTFSPVVIIMAMALPSLIIFPVKMRNAKARIISFGKSKWKKILLAAVINGATMLFLIQALKYGDVSKVTSVFQSAMALQVLVGIIFLDERKDIIRKIAGIVIVLAGIFLLV